MGRLEHAHEHFFCSHVVFILGNGFLQHVLPYRLLSCTEIGEIEASFTHYVLC